MCPPTPIDSRPCVCVCARARVRVCVRVFSGLVMTHTRMGGDCSFTPTRITRRDGGGDPRHSNTPPYALAAGRRCPLVSPHWSSPNWSPPTGHPPTGHPPTGLPPLVIPPGLPPLVSPHWSSPHWSSPLVSLHWSPPTGHPPLVSRFFFLFFFTAPPLLPYTSKRETNRPLVSMSIAMMGRKQTFKGTPCSLDLQVLYGAP